MFCCFFSHCRALTFPAHIISQYTLSSISMQSGLIWTYCMTSTPNSSSQAPRFKAASMSVIHGQAASLAGQCSHHLTCCLKLRILLIPNNLLFTVQHLSLGFTHISC